MSAIPTLLLVALSATLVLSRVVSEALVLVLGSRASTRASRRRPNPPISEQQTRGMSRRTHASSFSMLFYSTLLVVETTDDDSSNDDDSLLVCCCLATLLHMYSQYGGHGVETEEAKYNSVFFCPIWGS